MTEFFYTITARGARIEPVREPGTVVVIPEKDGDGVPVTELAPYVLSRTGVEELYLPSGLQKIGAYAFYNCEKLRYIRCYGRIRDLGAGLFAGAGRVERLDIVLSERERSCLKELLSELPQTLRVRIYEAENGREARLIFPEFYEESIENTPARILVIETHGCGHRYRYCFYNTEFKYQAYDELFPQVQIQESEALAAELAFGRIRYPLGLTEKNREMYTRYLREHWRTAGRLMMEADRGTGNGCGNIDPGELPWFVEKVLAENAEEEIVSETPSHIPQMKSGTGQIPNLAGLLRELTRMAQESGDTEAVVWLMDFAHRQKTGRGADDSMYYNNTNRKICDPDHVKEDSREAAGCMGQDVAERTVRRRRFEL